MLSQSTRPFETFARLRGWARARTKNRAGADKALRVEVAGVGVRDRGNFLVNEVAPFAIQILAQSDRAAEAADLLTALGEFQPTPRTAPLGVSHARELAQLRSDLTTYTTL